MVAKDNEEEFPDLGDSMFSSKPKAKAKAKTAVVKPVGPSAEDLKTPHKGKPSSFFNLTENTPNQDQMSWVFEFYPEYGSEPNFGPVFAAWKQSAEYTENLKNPYRNPNEKKENEYGDYGEEEEENEDQGYSTFGSKQVKG